MEFHESYLHRAQRAAEEFAARSSRQSHPEGRTDNVGRWYPADREWRTCCNAVRSPSRSWPWSLMVHCRTAEHVANLHNVRAAHVRKLARTLDESKARVAILKDLRTHEDLSARERLALEAAIQSVQKAA